MLYDFGVWLAGLILFAPALVLGLAWVRSERFYESSPTPHWRKVFYRVAVVAGSASSLVYLGYWAW
jgi:hypothetical protein